MLAASRVGAAAVRQTRPQVAGAARRRACVPRLVIVNTVGLTKAGAKLGSGTRQSAPWQGSHESPCIARPAGIRMRGLCVRTNRIATLAVQAARYRRRDTRTAGRRRAVDMCDVVAAMRVLQRGRARARCGGGPVCNKVGKQRAQGASARGCACAAWHRAREAARAQKNAVMTCCSGGGRTVCRGVGPLPRRAIAVIWLAASLHRA